MKKYYTCILLNVVFTLTFHNVLFSQTAIKVEIKKTAEGWQLYRDGKPYYIKGAGGDKFMDKTVECGGNSIRTWGAENAQQILDDAQKHGLTVMLGLWVQHERHGFDYNNKAKIEKQLNDFREVVKKFKDHPALLMWAVGNEYDLSYTNKNVWYAVNDIAKMIHQLDPNHPTCTVTAGTDSTKINFLMERAPEIDIYGINTYGDIGNLQQTLNKGGWNRAYIVTEWGPNGHWESAKTEWGSSIEQTSKEKANIYKERYEKYIAGDKEKCIGSYVFLWGFKQEYTGTWYGMFTEKGEPTETIDAMQYVWTGNMPANKAPSLDSIIVNGMNKNQNIYLKSQNKFDATVFISNKENDKLNYKWFILPESTDLKTGGDAESKPEELNGLIKNKKENKITFRAPLAEGAYRLFVNISDGKKVAYANVTFYVTPRNANDPPVRNVSFKKASLESFNKE